MLATQVLPEDTVDSASQDVSEFVGYLSVEGKRYAIRKGENKIGRDSSCSIVIENCTVSKLHAVIESDGRDETFIYDCGSTNLTKLGKQKLRPHCRYKLDDEAEVFLGNIIAKFKVDDVNSPVKLGPTIPASTQSLDELDDIFDLPTQAVIPSTSRNAPKPPDIFKTPNPVISNKKPSTVSKSDSNQDSGFSGIENSDIFNLTTQCQLPSTQCSESDKVKSLLNDGQDDVLCNLMSVQSPKCVTEDVDIFDTPTQVDAEHKNTQGDDSVLDISLIEKEDFIATQKFEVIKTSDAETEVYDVKKEIQGGNVTISSDNEADDSILEISLSDEKEDEIFTQRFDEGIKDSREGLPVEEREVDALNKTDDHTDSSQDLITTQVYEQETKPVEFSEHIESLLTNCFKETPAKPTEKSGDETESDLEIDNEKSITVGEVKLECEPQIQEVSHDSNDSYVFEVDQKQPDEDSDSTDCELEPQIKAEPVVFEDTQVLTLTPATGLQSITPVKDLQPIPRERRSPSPACWSQLSLEMPSTQDMQTTMDKILEKQVGNEMTNSPLKRERESVSSVDPSPAKKPRTERGLSRLWQAHDVAQIQPTRTRNSLRTPDTNKQSCRRSTRGKKSNHPDITPYLIRSRRKETPKENRPESARLSRRRKSAFDTPKRRTKDDPPVVAFTGFESIPLENIIRELGGDKTNDLSLASVVVANKVQRTVKFLCAVGLGLPITSQNWLRTCKKKEKFINPWDFILEDEEAEEKWDFDLRSSLERSKRTKLLEGYSVFATKNTKPPVKDLLAIVECCGGIPIIQRPTIWPRKTIIVSCEEDEELWPPPRVRNIKLVHYEFILRGVLQQKIDFKSYNLR